MTQNINDSIQVEGHGTHNYQIIVRNGVVQDVFNSVFIRKGVIHNYSVEKGSGVFQHFSEKYNK